MKTIRRLFDLVVPVLAVMVTTACGKKKEPDTPSVQEMLEHRPYLVGYGLYPFEDTSRPTNPADGFPGSASRVLPTLVYYPAVTDDASAPADLTDAPYPLVLYTHGFLANKFDTERLLHYVSSQGYVVAACDFPQTTRDSPYGTDLGDVVNQPGDVSFLIDQVAALGSDPASFLHQAVDLDRIGVVGLSLGAVTTLGIGFHPDYADPRIKAVAAIGAPYCYLPQEMFSPGIPTLLLHGDIDAVAYYEANAVAAYNQAYAPKYLVTIQGGSHAGFADSAALLDGLPNPDTVGCDFLDLNISMDDLSALAESLGGRDAQTIEQVCGRPCENIDTIPDSINVHLQLDIQVLTVGSFFDAHLKQDDVAGRFLTRTLPREISEVSVEWE